MFPQFDPSKMDPKLLMQLTQLVQQLPPEKIARMQSLMHNMMAGIDVRQEMEEFERTLPPGFRDKLVALTVSQGPAAFGLNKVNEPAREVEPVSPMETPSNLSEARRVILQAVADGRMSPGEAEKLLFPA